ncbi:MAG: HAD family phosphatase [Candidatus Saccharibacteria bacterium]
MIRALIFDCFGVLYHGSLAHLRELTSPDDWRALEDLRVAYDRGFIAIADYYSGLSELIGKTPDEIDHMMRSDHIRNEPLIDFIRTHRKEYKIALLTNIGTELLNRLFSPEEQTDFFDVVVESNKTGMLKPYPEIYMYAVEKLGLTPQECLMIDDLETNIDGAEAVGMRGIVFHTVSQFETDLRVILEDQHA